MIFKKLTVKYFCDSEPVNIYMSPNTSRNNMERGERQFSNSASSWRFVFMEFLEWTICPSRAFKNNFKNKFQKGETTN